MASRSGRVSKTRRLLVGVALIAALALPAPVAANGVLTSFHFELFDNCLSGFGPPNTQLTIELRGPGGGYQSHVMPTTDTFGDWNGCFWRDIDPGDSLVATDGNTSRTLVVPALRYTVNRVTDVVAGWTPPTGMVLVEVFSCSWSIVDCGGGADASKPASATGKFSFDLTSEYNVKGRDEATVVWQSPFDDLIRRELTVPYMWILVGDNEVFGEANPAQRLFFELRRANGSLIDSASARADGRYGDYQVKFRTSAGPVDIRATNTIGSNVASDAWLKVPAVHPQFDVANDVVSGKCFPNRPFTVYAENTGGAGTAFLAGNTSGNGSFSADLSSEPFDLHSGNAVQVKCLNNRGDMVEYLFRVP